jgi:hypothetical protein
MGWGSIRHFRSFIDAEFEADLADGLVNLGVEIGGVIGKEGVSFDHTGDGG